MQLGHNLVNGDKKEERINDWIKFINKNPSAQMYCARGGQRSKIAKEWIKEQGKIVQIVEGGYKELRNTCIQILDQIKNDAKEWIIIAGKTGNNKTKLIQSLDNGIDLEMIANHRGSTFGGNNTPQPTTINFENNLACSYLTSSNGWIALEDESRRIGKLVMPPEFYNKMQRSSIVIIIGKLENRIKNIYEDYIKKEILMTSPEALCNKLRAQLKRINRSLGHEHYKSIDDLIKDAFSEDEKEKHLKWIEMLLTKYYDKMYDYQLSKKQNRCLMKGDYEEVKGYLTDYKPHSL
jgi:tRNA 2-selenouridine synthase